MNFFAFHRIWISGFFFLTACSKDVGVPIELAPYTDKALVDSAKQLSYHYHGNTIQQGNNGQHGPYRLHFNSTAFSVLDTAMELPINKLFPDGSIVVKEVLKNGSVDLFAIMHKQNGVWRWGELRPDGTSIYSLSENLSICTNCHSQAGNRDFLLTYKFK
jgi:hypothetical protein